MKNNLYMKWQFFFVFTLLFSQGAFAQPEKKRIDSLNVILTSERDSMKKVSILLKICELCDIKDNLKYADLLIKTLTELKKHTTDTAQLNKLLSAEADAYMYKGVYYRDNKFADEKKCILNYSRCLAIYKQLNQTGKVERAVAMIESAYVKQGNIYMQLQTLKGALDYAKSKNDKILMARYIYRLAGFYSGIEDTVNAIKYAEYGIELEKEINKPERMARGYYLGAEFYLDINKNKQAIDMYNKALSEYSKLNDSAMIAYIFLGLGKTYANADNYNEAKRQFSTALNYTGKMSSSIQRGEILNEMGELEYKFRNYAAAVTCHELSLKEAESIDHLGGVSTLQRNLAKDLFHLKKFTDAKTYIEKSMIFMKEYSSVHQIMKTEKLAYKIDSALGNYKSALLHYSAYTQMKDKLNIEEVKKATLKEDLQSRFAEEKREQAILQLQKDTEVASEIKKQKLIRNGSIIGFLLLLVIAAVVLRSYFEKKKYSNEIAEQKHLIEEKQNEILDSITYAKRLQHAILPPHDFISKHLPDNFVLYKPKDIVAGDFYWAEQIGNYFFIAAADSTGHGVPGAMVSVICSNALNRSVKEFKLTDTGKVLDKARELVIETFEKSSEEVKDGMDISLLCIDLEAHVVSWSGANNPLWYVQDGELKEIKADKQPIGKTDSPKPFSTHTIECNTKTTFYLFTDGLPDQFGGPNGKKFKYKQFENLLVGISHLPMKEQERMIDEKFSNWKGELEQVDDVCVIGIMFQ